MKLRSKHTRKEGAPRQAQKELPSMSQNTERKAGISSREQESEIKGKSKARSWML